MKIRRRSLLGSVFLLSALSSAPALSQDAKDNTLTAVLHTDLVGYDPTITSSNVVAYHGAMVYDMLFGNDEDQIPQPQMVDTFTTSEDGLTWEFTLREGLKFSDGSDVTTADVIPSIARWEARSSLGKRLAAVTAEMKPVDDMTFQIVLTEPYPLLPSFLGSPVTPVLFIMPKAAAETSPDESITEYTGSGPFMLNLDETRPGVRYVYDPNPYYVPREEEPSGLAGGMNVYLDRVVFENMPDAQTAVAALQAGEIDFYEVPPPDFLPMLESDPSLTVEDVFKVGKEGYIALNWLQPPFNDVRARQAVLWSLDQEQILKANFSDPKWYTTHGSWFTYGTPLANDANTDWFKNGPDQEKAKALLEEAGYDGTPVTILQATDRAVYNDTATVLAQQLRAGGFEVKVEAVDWATVLERRPNKGTPEEGGWNIFISQFNGLTNSNPYLFNHMATTGEDGWFGWPSDEKNEELRAAWIAAETPEERKEIATEIQANAWDIVPHALFGHWDQPVAFSSDYSGFVSIPSVLPFWNVKKQ